VFNFIIYSYLDFHYCLFVFAPAVMTTHYEHLLLEMVILYYHSAIWIEVVEVVVELGYSPYSLTYQSPAAAAAVVEVVAMAANCSYL